MKVNRISHNLGGDAELLPYRLEESRREEEISEGVGER